MKTSPRASVTRLKWGISEVRFRVSVCVDARDLQGPKVPHLAQLMDVLLQIALGDLLAVLYDDLVHLFLP